MAKTFKEKFDAIKNTTKGKLIAFGLILLVNTGLLFFIVFVMPDVCLMSILVPLSIFGIQFLFGERRMSWLIVIGLVIILISGLILGAVIAYDNYNYTPSPLEGSTSTGVTVLTNGRVDPRSGPADQVYNYTITYTDLGGPPLSIVVNIYAPYLGFDENRSMIPVDPSSDPSTGSEYYHETTLPRGIYFYEFRCRNSTGVWANTTYESGPVNEDMSYFMIVGLSFLPYLAMIYLLIIMLYWWTQKAKTYRPQPPPPKEPSKEDEFTCSKCGADVPGDATKCPKCGEEFEEDEAEPKISEKIEKGLVYCKVCMGTIKKGDMILGCQCGRAYHLKCAQRVGKCPSCGTEFKET